MSIQSNFNSGSSKGLKLHWVEENVLVETLDVYDLKSLEEIANLEEHVRNGDCRFECIPCDAIIDDLPYFYRHCRMNYHIRNEEKYMQDQFEVELKLRKSKAIDCKQTTLQEAIYAVPNQLFYGMQYMMSFLPDEQDEIPIYVCGLRFCKFFGFAHEIAHHVQSTSHRKSFLDINGVTEPEEPQPSGEEDLIKLIHEYDLETSGQSNPARLIKKIVNTTDYEQVLSGSYPPSFYHFLEERVSKDYEESRQQKTHAEPMISQERGSGVSYKRSDSEKLVSNGSDHLREHLSNVKQDIFDLVKHEFELAGKLNGSSVSITNSVIQQLSTKYYRDEKLFHEKDLWKMSLTSNVIQRIRCRVLNFLSDDDF